MDGPKFQLHIAMYPWFAIGHISAYLHLANKLAKRGHKISFIVPKLTKSKVEHFNLYPQLVTFIPITMPLVDGLPPHAETTFDATISLGKLIMTGMDRTEKDIELLLLELKPNIVFFDYTCWMPNLARSLGIKSVHYITLSMIFESYMECMEKQFSEKNIAEHELNLLNPPAGFPDPSIKLQAHEVRQLTSVVNSEFGSGVRYYDRISTSTRLSDAVAFRGCREIEGLYADFLEISYGKPLLLSGPVIPEPHTSPLEEEWAEWLSGFKEGSVVYCAPNSIDQDGDVFVDACQHFPAEGSPEHSDSASRFSDPPPKPQSYYPAATIRRRPVRRGCAGTQSAGSSFESDLINDDSRRSFRHRTRHRNIKKDVNSEKPDSNEPQQVNASTEENNEGSTITSAANDDGAVDSVDSAPRLGGSSSSFLDLPAGLAINLLRFQMKLMFMFITYPLLFTFYSCVFFLDPLGTTKRGKIFLIGILNRGWCFLFRCIRPYISRCFKENESVWSVAFRWGWGFLCSIYVCCVMFGLLVSSFVFSGFFMKHLVEKPIQMREVLNFDYSKHSPVAYVPIMSCAGVIGGIGSEDKVHDRKWVGERFIPSKHKVQATVELSVPESGYNRNLGMFQGRC